MTFTPITKSPLYVMLILPHYVRDFYEFVHFSITCGFMIEVDADWSVHSQRLSK